MRWNALIELTIVFAIAILFWTFWLFRRLIPSLYAALGLSIALQSIIFLPLCFWWYNSSTAAFACVFLLSSFCCARAEHDDLWDWLSYAVSLGLLALMKPNIAGLLIACTLPLLFIAARRRSAMLLATAAGTALALAILLLHHISIPDMLASYRAVSIERGGFSRFGLASYSRLDKLLLLLWTLLLAAPLATLVPQTMTLTRDRLWRQLASTLLLFVALPVCCYGLLTNGEVKDMEMAVLIVACAVPLFAQRTTGPWLRSVFVAMVCSMVGTSLYIGVDRLRVLGIGPGQFFEFTGANRPVRDVLFSSLVATPYLDDVQHEGHRAAAMLPGPVFFGPRLEFDYADLRLPSPLGWPVYYQPGTSFARRDVQRLTDGWNSRNFKTLIFLGDDRSFYPPEFLAVIDKQYRRVPGYKDIQVYAHKTPCNIP